MRSRVCWVRFIFCRVAFPRMFRYLHDAETASDSFLVEVQSESELRGSVDAAVALVCVITLWTSPPCSLALWFCNRGHEMRGCLPVCSPSLASGARLCCDSLPSTNLNLNLNLHAHLLPCCEDDMEMIHALLFSRRLKP